MAGTVAARLNEVLLEQHAMTIAELGAHGLHKSTIHSYLSSGVLVKITSGIVGLAADPDPWKRQARAALLAHEGSVLSHQSAAQLLGITFRSPEIHVTAKPGTRQRPTVAIVHRTAVLPADHRTTVDGFPLTSGARTICDLAVVATSDRHFEQLVEQAILDRRVTREGLLACHDILPVRGRTGAARRRRVFTSLFADSLAIATSTLERHLVDVVDRSGTVGVVFQFAPPWWDGRYGIVDAAVPTARLIVEVDGRRFHATQQAFENDRARDRIAAEHGWRVLRFTWRDVVYRPDTVVQSLQKAIRLHRAPPVVPGAIESER